MIRETQRVREETDPVAGRYLQLQQRVEQQRSRSIVVGRAARVARAHAALPLSVPHAQYRYMKKEEGYNTDNGDT